MLTLYLLNERTSLLKLTKRGCVYPHIACRGVNLLLEYAESIALATPHLANLLAEKACDGNAKEVDVDDEVVHRAYVLS